MTFELGRAQPTPLDWKRWRDALLGGPPLAPIVEEFTVPEGWSVTVVEVAAAQGVRVHAFYSVFDHAVHAVATVIEPEQRAQVRVLFKQAAPVFDDEIVALGDL